MDREVPGGRRVGDGPVGGHRRVEPVVQALSVNGEQDTPASISRQAALRRDAVAMRKTRTPGRAVMEGATGRRNSWAPGIVGGAVRVVCIFCRLLALRAGSFKSFSLGLPVFHSGAGCDQSNRNEETLLF